MASELDILTKLVIFIIAAISAVVTFIKYITKKHDERYDSEITRLDTKIDHLKELLCTKLNDLKELMTWRKGDSETSRR